MVQNPALTNATMDYESVRSLIAEYLDGMGGEKKDAIKKLDQFLDAQRKRDKLP